ncbi:hypothetical protein [Paracoccus salsus]|uniref:hypothetical protein n=1 Tax=Paracoccus salsus TaxID=2911061 RepID=UPI001F4640F4|nr:hypothetical protein [Paracoccus salsus]MCF3974693.1 hypothetical protein [Paracoccus salsus]
MPGEFVVLEAGDVVTADPRLVEASNPKPDETVLTDEAVADDAASGEGIEVATGMATGTGRIRDRAQGAEEEAPPLDRRLIRGARPVWLTLALAALTIAAGILRGDEIEPGQDDRPGWAWPVGALCNNAELGDGFEDGRAGDPMEIALRTRAVAQSWNVFNLRDPEAGLTLREPPGSSWPRSQASCLWFQGRPGSS